MSKQKSNIAIYYMLNVLVFFIIFHLSRMTILEGDDLRIQEYFGDSLMKNISRAFQYANETYFSWHGRWWVCFVSVLLGLYNKNVYNVLNALIFVVIINLLLNYSKDNLKDKNGSFRSFCLVFAFCMLWIFTPSVFDSFFWLSGSVGYLWTMGVILAYGLCWYRLYLRRICNDETNKDITLSTSAFKSILFFFGGVLAGSSSEPGACTLAFSVFLYLSFFKFVKQQKIHCFEVGGFLGIVIGLATLLLAPGNAIRSSLVVSSVSSENAFFVVKYGVRIARELYYSLLYLSVPLGVYFFILIVNFFNSASTSTSGMAHRLSESMDSLLFICLSVISVGVMTFSSGFSTRIFLLPLTLIILACIRELCKISQTSIVNASKVLIISMAIFSLASIAFTIKEYDSLGGRIERGMYTDFFYSPLFESIDS